MPMSLPRTRDQGGASPVWMRGIGEDRFVQDIFPITGEFLLGGDAAGKRARAPAGTTDDDAFADFGGLRRAELKHGQIDFTERLYQAKAGFLVEAERVTLHHAAIAKMQPYRVGFGDQIANGEYEHHRRSARRCRRARCPACRR